MLKPYVTSISTSICVAKQILVIYGCSYCKTIFLEFMEPQETPKYAHADIQTKHLCNKTAEK